MSDTRSVPETDRSSKITLVVTKPDLDRHVERELHLSLDDYGSDKSRNPLYKAIANEIRHLRRRELIVDLRRTGKRGAGVGIWRLAEPGRAAKAMAKRDMANSDFSSRGHLSSAYVREKQNVFKEILLGQYKQCLFCKFDLGRWMVGAHIIPYSKMRKECPDHAMDPSNGLLLCKMCDVAFEYGHIMVGEDYEITVTDYLLGQKRAPVRSWLGSIGDRMDICSDVKYKPGREFLRRKMDLVTASTK